VRNPSSFTLETSNLNLATPSRSRFPNQQAVLPAIILEARSYNQARKEGSPNPFQPAEPTLVICSYHFARNKAPPPEGQQELEF